MAGDGMFADLLNRKYAIQEGEANVRNRLTANQADAIPSTTASENALRGAQAYQTTQQGNQVAPLAQAQIGEASARSGYYGAEGSLARTNASVLGLDLTPTGNALGRHIGGTVYDQTQANNGIGPDHAVAIQDQLLANRGGNVDGMDLAPGAFSHNINLGRSSLPAQIGFQSAPTNRKPPDDDRSGVYGGFKKGTANVPAKGKGKIGAAPPRGMDAVMAMLGQQGSPQAPGGAPPLGGPQVAPPAPAQPMPFMAGTPQVPGQGSGNVDKVPAMLAPHEAVLTHGAAAALGRDKIAALNAAHPPTPGRGAPSPQTKKPALRRGLV